MQKKRTILVKASALLLAAAPIMAQSINSLFIIGEPKLPEKLKKQ